ncbi:MULTISPECIES: DoxX family protein [Streptomyces]|uniref:DoxX family protein n=1 Tax=Streptomyces glycanivorans TaxID=3033808 RepID=A0ABY9JRF4_9ACTN|nr:MULTISPECIES: DoxX family protein [unclassified Streptomyces]WSQ81934.1 DoxX family protein [Streptomyces sp. NBC_01213]TXS12529.1 DoxX family protein [Streptomyces sp. wa22]WLQ68577.1 DoxX family protein [Streptomyces sp. Alt3]WSQ89263.1 DoxX family protein [Streptomyces sp. NBC_01212]WSR04730.1 DoxX family protein [Streptomyces sp. NBC_01208]
MAILRKVARPLLASVFISGGLRTLRDPHSVAGAAEPVARPVSARVPKLPDDTVRLVRINSAVQVGAGVLLATGRLPRASALALAASLVPTTLAGHAWWKTQEPEERARQQVQFTKNLSLLGGLLIAAADTHGKPSLAYRSRAAATAGVRSAHRTGNAVGAVVADKAHDVRSAAGAVREHLPTG